MDALVIYFLFLLNCLAVLLYWEYGRLKRKRWVQYFDVRKADSKKFHL